MEERQALFSLSWRFCFGLSLPFCWLVEKVSKNPVMFYQFIHILCAQRAKCTFPPAQGNARERKYAKPQCKKQCLLHCRAFSQQTGRLHAHIGNCKTKKRNSQAHILECLRAISVPANLLAAGAITKAGGPYICHHILQMGHLASQFQVNFSASFIHILEYKKVRTLWK